MTSERAAEPRETLARVLESIVVRWDAGDIDNYGAADLVLAVVRKADAALAATRGEPPEPGRPAPGLDVERLGDAIVAAVRAERAPIGYKGDGWPAYWEKDRPATVLAVSSLAKRLAAEYDRLAP